MNRRTFALPLAAALLTGVTGCAAVSGFFSDLFAGTTRSGPGQVNDLVGLVEQVYVNSELAKVRSQDAVEALQQVVRSDFKGDPVEAYAGLQAVIERSEEQAGTLRKSVEAMNKAADPVFEQWTADMEAFTSEEMRERSAARLKATRERYEEVATSAEATLSAYDDLNKSLRDHLLFLGHDFNPAAVSEIRRDVNALAGTTREFGQTCDASLVVCRAYVDQSALPGRPAPERKPSASDAVERVEPVAGTPLQDPPKLR